MTLPKNEIVNPNMGIKAMTRKALFPVLVVLCVFAGFHRASAQQSELMVRISEIEIDTNYLEAYKAILEKEAAASVRLEPGVIAIFPMYQKENHAQVRILEIYANKVAYKQHLKTPHFQEYKTSTLKMVKTLRLIDMNVIDRATMPLLFKKLKDGK